MKAKKNYSNSFKCIQCGATVPISAKICPGCGLELYSSDMLEVTNKDPQDLDIVSVGNSQKSIPNHLEYRFIIQWILANWLGGFAIAFIILVVYKTVYPGATLHTIGSLPGVYIIYATVVSVIQWFLFRDRVSHAQAWVLFTALGALMGAILTVILAHFGIVLGNWFSVLFGFMIGFAQYQILGRRFTRASWWIVTTTLGWVLSQEIGSVDNLAVQLLAGLILPAFTGFTLAWLLKYPLPDRRAAYRLTSV